MKRIRHITGIILLVILSASCSRKEDKVIPRGKLAEIYAQMLPYCKNAYVTKLYRDFEGEKFFPDLDKNPEWELKEEGELQDHEGLKYSFNRYENISVKEFE